MTSVQDITTVDLDVRHFEIACAIDNNVSGVVFLTSSFRVKTRTIKEYTKVGTIRNVGSGSKELAIVVNARYFCSDISELYNRR